MKCIYCEYACSDSTAPDCEYSFDPETGTSTLCGHKACPACGSCQGQPPASNAMVRTAKKRREIYESGA